MSESSIPVWLSMAIVAAVLLVLVVVLRILQLRTELAAESIRKLFHIGSAAAALTLPWLFSSVLPVLGLGAVSVIAFIMLRIVPVAREGPGQVLQAVPRQTMGEFWFILGVVTIFAITGDDIVVYTIGILILAVADSAAAIVGVFYGRHKFDVMGGTKTTEGSFAFFLIAFLCVHVPLLLFTEIGRLESLLIAINIALVLMLAEADAARGSDNFVLPVLVVVLLDVCLSDSLGELVRDLSVILALCLLVFFYRKRATLSADALIAAVLAGYIFWLFGDIRWLVPPVTLFATYTWLVGRPQLSESQPFHADVVLAVVAPGAVLVTLYELTQIDILYIVYVAIWSANLAVIGTLHRQLEEPARLVRHFAVKNTLIALVVMVPGVLVGGRYALTDLAAIFISIPISLGVFGLIGKTLKLDPTRLGSWWRVSVSVSVGAMIGFSLFPAY